MPDRDPDTGRLLQYRGPSDSPGCIHCPCAKDGKPWKAVPAFGATGGLVIVGEGPGAEELFQGYPFIGPSGRELNKVFVRGGIDRQLAWITNATLCKRPQDDRDLYKAMDCCRPRLEQELASVSPKAIVALGGTATRALRLPVVAVMEARGTVQESPFVKGVPVVTSLHPAALLRGGAGEVGGGGKQKMNVDAQMMFLQADVEKADRIARGELDPKWSDDIEVVTDPAAAEAAMRSIIVECRAWGMLGVDLEWDKEKTITWVGFGNKTRAVSFAAEALNGAPLMLAAEAMADPTLPKLIHNLQADKGVWEARVGPIRGVIEDSMLAHHAAFPGIAHDLQQVASQFLVVPPWKTQRREERKASERRARERAQAEVKAERKRAAEARNSKAREDKLVRDAQKKADKAVEHAAKQEAKRVAAAEKAAARQAAHAARIQSQQEAKERRKAEKAAAHAIHNKVTNA